MGVEEPVAGMRAVIVGSGMAGLATAAALAPHFREVVVLERDAIEEGVENPRPGVAQFSMLHKMMAKGADLCEALFPGYADAVVAKGACRPSMFATQWFEYGNFLKNPPKGCEGDFRALCSSRRVYEDVARASVRTLPNVKIRASSPVIGLEWSADASRVTGVKLENGSIVTGDLVVMAGGRGSALKSWLKDGGVHMDPPEVIDCGLALSACTYKLPDTIKIQDVTCKFCVERPPARTAICLPIDSHEGLIQAAFVGRRSIEPPKDHDGLLKYMQTLPHPFMYDLVSQCTPHTPVHTYKTKSQHFHFEKVALPEGFVVLGDAACHFNPAYGQGMSVGLMGADILGKQIAARLKGAGPGLDQQQKALLGLAKEFQPALAKAQAVPWQINTGDDVRYLQNTGGLPPADMTAVEWYLKEVTELAATDHRATIRILNLVSMLTGPESLFHPEISFPIVSGAVSRSFSNMFKWASRAAAN